MDYRIKENFQEITRSIPDLDAEYVLEDKSYIPINTKTLTPEKLAYYIDHTLLKPDATPMMVEKLCQEAKESGFFSVCVNPTYVRLAANRLEGSRVAVCTVIGFPLGANTSAVKAIEAQDAIDNGAEEIDMVINIGKAKEREYKYIEDEIKAVVSAAQGRTVKVILETCYLSEDEKIACCLAAQRAGAQFVKTSTGFGTGGAIITDVLTMRQTVGPTMGVKASGGVKTRADLEAFVKAGATRIGTSNGVQIMTDSAPKEAY